MRDKIIVLTSLLASLVLICVLVSPSIAFVYPDGSQDNKFESFGPRVDKVVIKKYAGSDAELQALQNGEIDITDSSLTKTWVDNFTSDPNIGMLKYGGEACYYTINFNHNNNTYLGNPEDPVYPNPVYPNPMSEVALRQACSCLIDRVTLCAGPAEGLYEPIYTPIPAYMVYWKHPEIRLNGTLENLTYPYSVASAASVLDAGGFPLGSDGWRYWDMNRNGVKDAGEDFSLTCIPRLDSLRRGAKYMLYAGFNDPAIHIHYWSVEAGNPRILLLEKRYHLYFGGWIFIGPNPDYLWDLYNYDNYYHPEDPPNYGAIGNYDPLLNQYSEGVKFATNEVDALANCLAFQEQFAATVCEIPLASFSAPKAYHKWYTGGNNGVLIGDEEDKYRGQAWNQILNEKGVGENSLYTSLNAYPGNYFYGDGNMIMRYGWREADMPQTLNPFYYSWYWEGEIINRIYDTLGGRNPMNLGPAEVPGLAENWTVGEWVDPRDHQTKTKITVKIRPDVFWSDGHPFDLDDVIYTFITLPEQLPDPWWWCFYSPIEGYYRLDDYTVDILLKNRDIWMVGYIFNNIVVPQHIWQPYIDTHTYAEFSGDFSTQPNMLTGTGPFKFVENTQDNLTMVRNTLYYQTMDEAVLRYERSSGNKFAEGITIAALTPSIQLRPLKIQSSWIFPASVRLTVPVTNLDVDDSCIIHEKAELLRHNGSIQTLLDVDKSLASFQVDVESFDVYNLENGQHTIRVTVEVTGGVLYDYVTANLPFELWQSILGPKTVTKNFWVTVLADIDENGTVDILDIVLIATNFGKSIGETGFKSEGDLNMDRTVDIFDIVNVAINFGWHY
jgi:ABC-type transport system substrate-binding protein